MAKFIIEGGKALSGTIQVSGNKNEALPALMASLLTDETIYYKRVPKIQDVLTVCEILKRLGAHIEWQSEDSLAICCKNVQSHQPDAQLCSKIRASMLLMGPLLARFGKIILPVPGGDVIGSRRIDTHFTCVEDLGATLEFGPPISGFINTIKGCEIFLDEPSVTATENAILLAVMCEGTTILHNTACEPHVEGLCHLLMNMGAHITGIGTNRLTITGVQHLHGTIHEIGSDFMEVGSFLCLSAISGGHIKIAGASQNDLRFIQKTFARLGLYYLDENNELTVQTHHADYLQIKKDIGRRIPSIYSGPWPAFPTDLMSVAIVAATQCRGTVIFHEKMYEGRMFFTDKLMAMGAEIVLCDPHRVVVAGPAQLYGATLSSPDVRAGMALVIAALIAKGTSEIHNIYQIERGYHNLYEKLISLGAHITRYDHS